MSICPGTYRLKWWMASTDWMQWWRKNTGIGLWLSIFSLSTSQHDLVVCLLQEVLVWSGLCCAVHTVMTAHWDEMFINSCTQRPLLRNFYKSCSINLFPDHGEWKWTKPFLGLDLPTENKLNLPPCDLVMWITHCAHIFSFLCFTWDCNYLDVNSKGSRWAGVLSI